MIAEWDIEDVRLATGDLVVRPWRAADADSVYRACQDELIQRWTSVPVPYERRHAETFVTDLTRGAWSAGTAAPLGVFDAAGGLLGAHGLVTVDRDTATAELGVWVAPWARGRGVATGATGVVRDWALHTLGLRRLLWWVEVGNGASLAVGRRCGFRFGDPVPAAIVDRDGSYRDGWRGLLLHPDARHVR